VVSESERARLGLYVPDMHIHGRVNGINFEGPGVELMVEFYFFLGGRAGKLCTLFELRLRRRRQEQATRVTVCYITISPFAGYLGQIHLILSQN
jgi:hypothetical protein